MTPKYVHVTICLLRINNLYKIGHRPSCPLVMSPTLVKCPFLLVVFCPQSNCGESAKVPCEVLSDLIRIKQYHPNRDNPIIRRLPAHKASSYIIRSMTSAPVYYSCIYRQLRFRVQSKLCESTRISSACLCL